MTSHNQEYLAGLVRELGRLPAETEWVEFKENQDDPPRIGEYISALANGAALAEKEYGYVVWGVADGSHSIVGTNFAPHSRKVGNEPMESWLRRGASPYADFRFYEVAIDGKSIVILEISRAAQYPVAFQGGEFIRIGSVTKKLQGYPEIAERLWRILGQTAFENGIAAERVDSETVLQTLNYPAYFAMLAMPAPNGHAAILEALESDRLIAPCAAGGWNITNMGAVLFARNLADFPGLRRKALRIVQYRGTGKLETLREQVMVEGYAASFQSIVEYIMTIIPANEVIEQALRHSAPMFPELALRELVANALIHQDFLAAGTGPMVELFDDRIEITNPGRPLVAPERFVDHPPQSRNETLAALLRRLGICEERGSGIDKVVAQIEVFQLPAALFEALERATRSTLFAYKSLSAMDKPERVRACYQHACLRYVTNQPMSNTSVRERFGIPRQNAAQASRLLSEAVAAGVIIVRDPESGTRNRTYRPFWAG